MRAPNEARGEVALTVGGEELIICTTIQGIAKVSAAIKADTLQDIFTKIGGGEPNACLTVLAYWVVEGEVEKALANLKVTDFLKIGAAGQAAMAAHMDGDDDTGKPGAGAVSS